MKSTMVELVQELEKLPRSADLDVMIQEAKAGEYHDYKNNKYACGKMESFNRLNSLGRSQSLMVRVAYRTLAERIADGEFDEIPDADDIAKMKEYAPQELWSALGLDDLTEEDIKHDNKARYADYKAGK